MGQIVRFGCLVDLRSSETLQSVKLINDKEAFAKYYDVEQMILQNYKFPSIFLRQTKKAFVSFVTPSMIDIVKKGSFGIPKNLPTYNALRLTCQRKGITCDLRFARKIQASWLHRYNVPDVMIDLLQGRVGKSVLVNHYLAPSLDHKAKVLQALEKLKEDIEQ